MEEKAYKFDDMPNEIVALVLPWLSNPKDLGSFSVTARRNNDMTSDYWPKLIRNHIPSLSQKLESEAGKSEVADYGKRFVKELKKYYPKMKEEQKNLFLSIFEKDMTVLESYLGKREHHEKLVNYLGDIYPLLRYIDPEFKARMFEKIDKNMNIDYGLDFLFLSASIYLGKIKYLEEVKAFENFRKNCDYSTFVKSPGYKKLLENIAKADDREGIESVWKNLLSSDDFICIVFEYALEYIPFAIEDAKMRDMRSIIG